MKKISSLILAAYCIGMVIYVAINDDQFQWDFRIYYYAAEADAIGLNPYDSETISTLAKMPIGLNFVYHPICLFIFKPLLAMDYKTAYDLYLLAKCAVLLAIMLLWRKEYSVCRDGPMFYLFCVLAFNSAIPLDLMAGNVSIFEQLFIWLSFSFLLRGKPLLFMISVVVASMFKISPLILLTLGPIVMGKRGYYFLFGGLISFGLILVISYISDPALFGNFIKNAAALNERGIVDPSVLALIKDPFILLERRAGISLPIGIAYALYAGGIIAILTVSRKSYLLLKNSHIEEKNMLIIFFVCVVLALVLPRFKSYSYILLIVPSYYLIKSITIKNVYPFLFIAMILTTVSRWNIPGSQIMIRAFWDYYSLLLAFGIWLLYIKYIKILLRENDSGPTEGMELRGC